MDWESCKLHGEENCDPILQIPATWLFSHYYEALNLLFRIENALRVFVFVVLKGELGEKWKDLSLEKDGTISSISKRRSSQAEAFGHIGSKTRCPMMELTSGELIRLILDKSYWGYFSRYFPASHALVKSKLEEVIVVRNSLAHFRPISATDVTLVKENARQILPRVNECLNEVLCCSSPVPSNTEDEWYYRLKSLQSAICKTHLNESKTGDWISLTFSYSAEILRSRCSESSAAFQLLKIKTPVLLDHFPTLRSTVVCILDLRPSVDWHSPPTMPRCVQKFQFVFRRSALKSSCPSGDLERLLSSIFDETEMITRDNLSKGKFIEISHCSSVRPEQGSLSDQWYLRGEWLDSSSDSDHPEYWGGYPGTSFGYISGTCRFPWMTQEISENV